MDVTTQAEQAGRQADNSAWMDHAVRLGLVSYGVVHLLIAWLALRLAFGDSGGSASSQGALHQLGKTPPGLASLYVVAVGFVALVVWQLLEAIWGHRDEEGATRLRKRLTSAAKAVLYGSLAVTRVQDRHRLLLQQRWHRRPHGQADATARRAPAGRSRRRRRAGGGRVPDAPRGVRGLPLEARLGGRDRQGRSRLRAARQGRLHRQERRLRRRRGACSSTPRSRTTRRSPPASTRRCTRCCSSRSALRCWS